MTPENERLLMQAADRITAELTQARYERDEARIVATRLRGMLASRATEIQTLRAALKPLADIAAAIDGPPGCSNRSDNSTIWQGNAMQRGPFDLTMAHVRAARLALEGGDAES